MSQHKHHNRKAKLQRRAKIWKALWIAVAAIAVLAVLFFGTLEIISAVRTKQAEKQQAEEEAAASTYTPPAEEDTSWHSEFPATHTAEIEIADYGTIKLNLCGDTAPKTVENFVSLAQSGFYDGLTFHRVMQGFMIQGGDPEGTGQGGSENMIEGEFSSNGFENNLEHRRGVISMARSGSDYDGIKAENSASCQFFIMHADYPSLNGSYASFGYVTEGMEIVDAIVSDAVAAGYTEYVEAADQPVITKITVTEVQS